ncbi:AAA family ATPase [Acinetobacter lactucae]|uniref:AAA family ATPase n=1 Tax=Acinetobacter lactucae TaxID=1785128 RepID=UPI000F7B9DAD|nr:AAA family ATPase [Acinetobacter lactucae]RSO34411.1 ATP-binding protein [Acinetobacter lactucae]
MSISGAIPHAGIENINIPLNGRNLIITGKNGSGKTSFLTTLERNILNKLEKKDQQLLQSQNNIESWTNYRNTLAKTSEQYINISTQIENEQKKIQLLSSGFQLNFNNFDDLQSNYDNFKAIFRSFPAMRISSINHTTQTTSLIEEKTIAKQNFKQNLGSKLEQHLINIKTSEAFAKGIEKDEIKGKKFEEWFLFFDTSLKKLFENNNAKLVFSNEERKFRITDGKITSSFQDLSSGYKAIFDIYADLLLRTEFFDITPSELQGLVLIDEIDAHLHISLQKLILPFFSESFPNIQFIVSTHSPFVITSTDKNTVVYDISSDEFFENDLSRYSYNSVIKGLFHVDPLSDQLKTEIQTIATILKSEPNNYLKLRETLRNIAPYAKQLDVESKSFYFKALNHLLDNQELGDLDV